MSSGPLIVLPDRIADPLSGRLRWISERTPYSIPGELQINAGDADTEFDTTLFQPALTEIVELTLIRGHVSELEASDDPVDDRPSGGLPEMNVTLAIKKVGGQRNYTDAQRLTTLFDYQGGSYYGQWRFDSPLYLRKQGDGLILTAHNFFAATNVRIEIGMFGSLLWLGPEVRPGEIAPGVLADGSSSRG
jgi:hypothetical protein